MTLRILTAAAVCVGVFGLGMAQAADEQAAPKQERAQAHERQMGGAAGFAQADANGDGILSLEEFKAMDEKRMADMKARMGDKFDEEKMRKMPSADERFVKLDTDASGSLTKEELMAGRRQRGEGRGPGKGPGAKKEQEAPADAE